MGMLEREGQRWYCDDLPVFGRYWGVWVACEEFKPWLWHFSSWWDLEHVTSLCLSYPSQGCCENLWIDKC